MYVYVCLLPLLLHADKDYKKSHLGSEWKKPFAGASHAKGIVLEKM
jgi:small subunit ribosomal protein S23e